MWIIVTLGIGVFLSLVVCIVISGKLDIKDQKISAVILAILMVIIIPITFAVLGDAVRDIVSPPTDHQQEGKP